MHTSGIWFPLVRQSAFLLRLPAASLGRVPAAWQPHTSRVCHRNSSVLLLFQLLEQTAWPFSRCTNSCLLASICSQLTLPEEGVIATRRCVRASACVARSSRTKIVWSISARTCPQDAQRHASSSSVPGRCGCWPYACRPGSPLGGAR